MKIMRVAPLMAVLLLAANASWVNAQPVAAETAAPLTRAQVKMERDEFLKSHTWDAGTDNWVLKPGYESPVGMKSRAEIKAERDEIMRNNRWDEASDSWIPLKSKPRDLGKMPREQMRIETRAFVRTHTWNEGTQSWLDNRPAKKK